MITAVLVASGFVTVMCILDTAAQYHYPPLKQWDLGEKEFAISVAICLAILLLAQSFAIASINGM